MSGRDFDVVLFGATSFVGRLTARYLLGAAPDGARVALAGRSQQRLQELRSSLGVEWPLLVADVDDPDSLASLAQSTRVLASTVGPYRRYGIPVVEACARAGTHYADLTGEVLFIRESIDRFHEQATESGAKIVHSCGFDSIPSDLGVMLLHEAAGGELEETTLVVRALRGGASGGTLASIKLMIEDRKRDPSLAALIDDPYALSPDRGAEPDLGDERDLLGVERDELTGGWVGPFVMAQFNTRVVRRSNALLGWAYGRKLRYREVMGFGGPLAPALAAGTAAGMGAMLLGLQFGPAATVLDRVLPAPGEGPGERARERGHFRIETHARSAGGEHWVCRIAANGDPGYKATAVMFGESAMALAYDGERLPATAGVLTPATALAGPLVERLRAAGHTYEVGPARG
ncbi:MAG TPA: saccharopine dehydrogenase NADP-binding domain-containing protein [Solirubrobacteraceae bacterium]|nr:saccharopine dehydrogenase NADP-binding domain-containing protein [Solirubrobacteraceae bacterium]